MDEKAMERKNKCIWQMSIECLLIMQNNESDKILWGLKYIEWKCCHNSAKGKIELRYFKFLE